jgi:glycerophosphoryl diester phosphodiesterase
LSPLVIAHRGGALEAPENSLPAFRRALALGAHGIELDVHVSADGVLLVHHDGDLVTVPGAPREPIAGLPAARVEAADLEWTHGAAFRGLRPPRLEAVLDLAAAPAWTMIELKGGDASLEDRLARAVRRLLAVRPGRGRRRIGSFSAPLLARVARELPQEALLAIVAERESLAEFQGLPLAGVAADRAILDAAWVAELQGRGLPLWAWTIATPEEAETARRAGVAAWITDIPGRLLGRSL